MKIRFLNQKSVFILILILQISNILFWGIKKEGYYIDELWSYGLANGYYQPSLWNTDEYMQHWHSPDFYKAWLVANDNERFQFGSVYYNQSQDVHPPFFYYLLHFISSIFKGTFSKWFGLSINLLFFILSLWILYLISIQLIGSRWESLIPSTLFGFSVGGVTIALYIRMYMMLTFWVLLFLHLSVCFLKKEPTTIKVFHYVAIWLTVFSGGMTQYFFWIYAFFVTIMIIGKKTYEKQIKIACNYAATVLSAVITEFVLFPAAATNILCGSRTDELMGNAAAGLKIFFVRINDSLQIICRELFFNKMGGYVLLIGLLITLILYALLFFKRNEAVEKNDFFSLIFCAVSAGIYFLVAAKIIPDIQDRYFFLIYPIILLCVTVWFVFFFDICRIKNVLWFGVALYLIVTSILYQHDSIGYIYHGYKEALWQMQTTYADTDAIYITKGDHLLVNNCLFLMQQKNSYPVSPDNLTDIRSKYEPLKDSLIIYVDIYYDEEKIAQDIADLLSYPKIEHLYDNTFTQIFVLKKN